MEPEAEMATLEGHERLIAVRSRGSQPASLMAVVLIAAATLGLAVAIAELGDSTGRSSTPVARAEPAPAAAPEALPSQAPLPRGYTRRYEGSSLSVVPKGTADGGR
jgi:hypothetical protein